MVVLTAKDITPENGRSLDRQADRVITKGSISLADLAQELRDLIRRGTDRWTDSSEDSLHAHICSSRITRRSGTSCRVA